MLKEGLFRIHYEQQCPNCSEPTIILYIFKKLIRCGSCLTCPKHKAYRAIRKPKADCETCRLKWRMMNE